MKLKKIASLMLAGVMAVSMLAGCNGKTEEKPGDENTNVAPVTGAAAVVNSELNENKDKISFTDNKVVTDLLTNYFKENPVQAGNWTNASSTEANHTEWYGALQNSVKALIGAKNSAATSGVQGVDNFGKSTNDTGTYFNMYVLNTEFLTKEDALRMVAHDLDDIDLPEEGSADGKDPATKDFSYTGSISAIKAESKGGTESVWVIVATMTKTAADK